MYFGDMDSQINSAADVGNQLGLSPGGSRLSGYEGQALPASTYTGHDAGAVPWSPDSPVFWLAVIGGATLLGWVGASFNVRAGRASAQIGVNSK